MFCRFARQLSSVLCAAFLFVGWCGSVVYAQPNAKNQQTRNIRNVQTTLQSENPANPTVMMREMQATLQKLPWNELTPSTQAKIKKVASGSPLFHRMPQQRVYADPEIYQFLLRHPDMVIGFWEQLGTTQLSFSEVRENHYVLRETGGTVASIEILYRTDNLCIVYAKGEYRGPLLAKAYQGDVILILRTQYSRDEKNEPMVVCDLDTLIQINSLGADMLVKLLFTSLTKVADSNFEVTISFVSEVSRAASRTPIALKDTAEEITSVRQDVCAEFCDIVDMAAMRFARRRQQMPSPTTKRTQQSVAQSLDTLPKTPPQPPQDFALSSRPPVDWGMDHFFAPPKSEALQSQPFYEPVHFGTVDGLAGPKVIDSERSNNTVQKLPRSEW